MEPSFLPGVCPEIRALLEAELAAGNAIAYVDRSMANPKAHLVMLTEPFRVAHVSDLRVRRVEVNDPHWWAIEFTCRLHAHQLVCPMSAA